jgi:hypothetical protein
MSNREPLSAGVSLLFAFGSAANAQAVKLESAKERAEKQVAAYVDPNRLAGSNIVLIRRRTCSSARKARGARFGSARDL